MSPASSRPLTRRALLASSGVLAAAAGLTGCGSGRPTVTLYQSKPEAIPHFSQVVGDFNGEQKQYRYVHDIATNLSASFVRHSPPDIACQNYNLEMARFMERGALSDLADMPVAKTIRKDVLDLADWYPTYEGRTSVIPYSVTGASVIYNKSIFAHHGLEVPTTWDDFLDVCQELKKAGATPIYGTFRDPWTITQGLFDYTVGGMVDVRSFYEKLNAIGEDVGPDSEVSFQKTLLEPIQHMVQLLDFHNEDASSRGYGDGNTAMAAGKAAMCFQGPWAIAEIDKVGGDAELGTFPLPMTGDAKDLKIRVNIDLSLWIPEAADQIRGARDLLNHLMEPELQNSYNKDFLAFGTTKDAPPVSDDRIVQMQDYYDNGAFYMGPSQFIPRTIPYENYLQSIAFGADPEPVLARLDSDWARLAYRQ
ncbi:substrate-binding domain-containing protein [Brachybacterium halotolerans subsp. kimchii]|uniref:ABC transporter substrate-binding protein n=1 Tax=Brachybacterium halotolerans TaxID=2795215 RepID=UPI001E3F4500|nr:substrate-binding domain-containing protein [Brachybacterium halotolerans]UEJ81575.1 substrate-binding domain-containing protein [Brachybacterium halotolerans subsp. kimchii]